ncbi:MFS transporter [Cellulomonas cellasea]|uniref:EmrB/QacA subfamily drug resistance transporter n=1 Tax=Cellulomonas cellasea TaxID=43670 RepID=A0A7W4UI76_9CELL|nr:MFS transporter [Cellulomonas cellasea]MBB2924628.1 EmrB/QacA subfamily drug resistance transporter [Cellulomonas cellasea]
MTATLSPHAPETTSTRRRWWILVVVSLTQLVVVLDGTIVNIALPQAQQSIGLSDLERQWVVTAYALCFGALLLLGGRIADYGGRKRTFLVGMVGFGLASGYGGLVDSGTELIVARGLQGVFAALMAPAALAILTTTFPVGKDRITAFAVFGSIAGAGAGIGLVLGGVLTEFASWRWCLLVNVPVVAVAVVAGALLLTESRAEGDTTYDWVGGALVVLGLGSLVYGFTRAEHGWGHADVVGFIGAGVVLLALFVLSQTKVAHPLLPLRVVRHRVRAGALLLQAVAGTVMIGAMLYVTLHLQIVLALSPLQAGLASLPLTVAIGVVAPLLARLLPVTGPRVLMITGPLVGAAAMVYLSRLTADGTYAVQVLPALIVLGIGMAMMFVPMQNLALVGVEPHDAGVASAATNAAMQIGGSIGLAVFTSVYASASAGGRGPAALVDGYSAAFVATAVALLVAAVIAVVCIRGTKEELMPSGEGVVHLG